MSQIISNSTDGVQFILDDPNLVLERILDSSQCENMRMNDIIYTDTSQEQYCLVDGQLFSSDNGTVVLQETDDLSQYYIDSGLSTPQCDEPTNKSEVVHFIDEEGSLAEQPHVIYVNNELDLSQYHLVDTSLCDDAEILESQVINLDELMDEDNNSSSNTATYLENVSDNNGFQFAIIKDGKLHLQAYNNDMLIPVTGIEQIQDDIGETIIENTSRYNNVNNSDKHQSTQILQTSEVYGRDRITGETVKLDNYINNLQKRMKCFEKNININGDNNKNRDVVSKQYETKQRAGNSDGLHGLLNRKLDLGKTTDGKRLVARIVKVHKKKIDSDVEDIQSNDAINSSTVTSAPTESIDINSTPSTTVANTRRKDPLQDTIINNNKTLVVNNTNQDNNDYVIQNKIVSKECFQHISGTLGGLMNMETVRKKIQDKNILVEVIEKRFVPTKKAFDKSISYTSGYMERRVIKNEDGVEEEHDEQKNVWYFVPDSNTRETLMARTTSEKSPDSINVAILITYHNNKERIQVTFDTKTDNKCADCPKIFRTKSLLRVHMTTEHNRIDNNNTTTSSITKLCDTCGLFKYTTKFDLEEHKKTCKVRSKLSSRTQHLAKDANIIECNICYKRFSNLSALNTHFAIHADRKSNKTTNVERPCISKRREVVPVYSCHICKKTFSRLFNLQRHVDVHKGQGNLYQCGVCGCSYYYISSLTRHVLQNHLQRNEQGIMIAKTEDSS